MRILSTILKAIVLLLTVHWLGLAMRLPHSTMQLVSLFIAALVGTTTISFLVTELRAEYQRSRRKICSKNTYLPHHHVSEWVAGSEEFVPTRIPLLGWTIPSIMAVFSGLTDHGHIFCCGTIHRLGRFFVKKKCRNCGHVEQVEVDDTFVSKYAACMKCGMASATVCA